MDYQPVLEEIAEEVRPLVGQGRVADYIPKLAAVPADRFAMAVQTVDGETYSVGDARQRFSIQSISKVFTLTLALKAVGEEALFRRVGREPSGNPFNSLVQLEYEDGIPRNPLINAGAEQKRQFACRHQGPGAVYHQDRHLGVLKKSLPPKSHPRFCGGFAIHKT